MSDQYVLTEEQKAAMESEKAVLGDVSYEIAHQYLMINHPDLFNNSGDNVALVRMNWGNTVTVQVEQAPPPAT